MLNLVENYQEFKEGKNIDQPTMTKVLDDVFRTLIKKKYGTDENFDIIINTDNGDLELLRVREIVADGEVTDEQSQISISEAQSIDEDYEEGEECFEQLYLEQFGRRAIMAARQTLISRLMELEKDEIFKKYKDREGELIVGEVGQILKREILIIDDATDNELTLPRRETIRGDFFKKGEMVRAVIKEVEMKNNNPKVIVSRTSPKFLEKLLEQEVPEIEDGLIAVKKIVRMPGMKAKVAVESFDDRIDPVGACVGMRGSRIHVISRELNNESIDVIDFTNNLRLLIQRSLTPAKIDKIEIDEENLLAKVFMASDQLSWAIGKRGVNINLAIELTGYNIEVKSNESVEEDVDLDEFTDEIEPWVIDELKAIGCDTALQVLELSKEELVRRTDLEDETVEDLLKIINTEFEK